VFVIFLTPWGYTVRLDPILIELEKEQEDLLIIGHASVIRCMLAYLIGLPASEIPAIEIARGDLLEVVPASYGVHSQAFHFWDGPGRRQQVGGGGEGVGGKGERKQPEVHEEKGGREEGGSHLNFYENFAEDTKGKREVVDLHVEWGEGVVAPQPQLAQGLDLGQLQGGAHG